MDASVNVRVVVFVKVNQGVNDLLGLLSRRRVIQVGQPFTVYLLVQDGKISGQIIDIVDHR
jgi:hypothetical protein